MRLLRLFIAQEVITQMRSTRFRALAAVYVIATSIPALMAFLISGRSARAIGPTAYNTFLLSEQPLLTALLAAGLAIDALSREREEGSFSVLSVAAISSVGYVLCRWLAIVAICVPISFTSTIISAALAIHTRQTLSLLPMFAEGWMLSVLPSLIVSSALALALGTITGRTVLSIIFAALLFTIGLDTLNGWLFYLHRLNFAGPGDLFAGGERAIREMLWMIRGYWFPDMPSDAAFLLRTRGRMLLPRAGVTTAMTMVLLALSAFYLRRTRRDLRPWKIPEKHQLRTLLRTINRVREEYAPDSGAGTSDRVVLVVAFILAAFLVGSIVQRQSAFASLAATRYAAETGHATPTNTNLVADSMHIDGEIRLSGELRASAKTVIRNAGDRSESHLSFALNPSVGLRRIVVDAGSASIKRVWERLDVDLVPPLAAGQSRTLSFEVSGTPGKIDFNLQAPGNFREQWKRYQTAKESIFMTDLSRSFMMPAATEVRMLLRASEMVPVLRYSEWTLKRDDQGSGFVADAIMPSTAIEIRLRHPYPIAVDSCGAITASSEIVSRCSAPLGSYVVFGGPLTERTIGSAATLAYIPAHEWLAQSHAQSLGSSIRLASEAWPQLALPAHLIFVERPSEPGDRQWYNEFQPWRTIDQIGSSGAVFFVPETIFTTTKPINPNFFAASIIAGTLRGKRRTTPEEAGFFAHFYTSVAVGRLGMRKGNAVEPGAGYPPETTPLIDVYPPQQRMTKVLAAIEYRVGANHFVEGINAFVHGGDRTGTAKELLEAIGRSGGVDLTRTYEDYFVGRALPELTLVDVTFHHVGQRWEVTGAVKNQTTGEAFVPIALRTSQGSLWQTIRVDSGGRSAFSFSATSEPHSIQLDPDRVCYRHAAIGLVETVEYRGES